MVSMRNLVIAISGAVLLAAPLINAQDVRLSPARLMFQPVSLIRELPLQPQHFLGAALRAGPVLASAVEAPDLSRYREFEFGMNLPAIAKLAGVEVSEAEVIHQRPAMLQELNWRPLTSSSSTPQEDPIKAVLFSFYNGQLFRMVVNYDREKTEGLTTEDVVNAISARYGTATRPAVEITFSTSQIDNDSEMVLARWEDSQYSFSLFRSSYQPTFGMLIFSKRLDQLAQAATAEAIRLDAQEAPQRESERQKKQDEENRAGQEKARLENKPNFRP